MKERFCIRTHPELFQTAPNPHKSPFMRANSSWNLPHPLPQLSLHCSLSSSSSHPPLHPPLRPQCVRTPQMQKILFSLFFPAVFYIFIFILLYLITVIPLSISFIPASSLFASVHPLFQSHLSLSTSHLQSNSSPCFIPRKPSHLDFLSLFYPSIHLSIQSSQL